VNDRLPVILPGIGYMTVTVSGKHSKIINTARSCLNIDKRVVLIHVEMNQRVIAARALIMASTL
jgi:hypothetical protein